MPLEIEIPVVADARALSDLTIDNQADDFFLRSILQQHPVTEEARAWLAASTTADWANNSQRIVRDTDDGSIASYIRYSFLAVDNSDLWKALPPLPTFPEDLIRSEQFRALVSTSVQKRIDCMGNRAYVHISMLNTHPSKERRGAASMLMHHVLQLADKHNLPIFLIATAKGKPLYDRLGFVERDTIDFDMSIINEPVLTRWVMTRPQPRPDQPSTVPAKPLRPVQVVPMNASLEEAANLERSLDISFGPDPLIALAFLSAEPEPMDVRAAKMYEQMQNPDDFLFHKAIDSETGATLGYAKWMWARDPHNPPKPFPDPGPGVNKPLFDAVFQTMETKREDCFKELNEPYIYMATLVVTPAAQRRGVGSALLRAGLAISDAKGWKAYINASPSGAPLYRKMGWQDYFKKTVNLKDYGGADLEETEIGLLRQANAKEVPRAEAAT